MNDNNEEKIILGADEAVSTVTDDLAIQRENLNVSRAATRARIISTIGLAVIFSIAMIICVYIGVKGLADYKRAKSEITISGYSKQQITSDLVVWSGYFSTKEATTQEGYAAIANDKQKVLDYLTSHGIKSEEIEFSAISINEEYDYYYDEKDHYKSYISGYTLGQTVTVSSADIEGVTTVSRTITELINEDIKFQSRKPEYKYTRLEELKIDMLADAAKDARNRAEIVATNAGSGLGDLTYAKLSSIKVSPLYTVANDFDNQGYYGYVDNDVASIEKEVTVTVNCRFVLGK